MRNHDNLRRMRVRACSLTLGRRQHGWPSALCCPDSSSRASGLKGETIVTDNASWESNGTSLMHVLEIWTLLVSWGLWYR